MPLATVESSLVVCRAKDAKFVDASVDAFHVAGERRVDRERAYPKTPHVGVHYGRGTSIPSAGSGARRARAGSQARRKQKALCTSSFAASKEEVIPARSGSDWSSTCLDGLDTSVKSLTCICILRRNVTYFAFSLRWRTTGTAKSSTRPTHRFLLMLDDSKRSGSSAGKRSPLLGVPM